MAGKIVRALQVAAGAEEEAQGDQPGVLRGEVLSDRYGLSDRYTIFFRNGYCNRSYLAIQVISLGSGVFLTHVLVYLLATTPTNSRIC